MMFIYLCDLLMLLAWYAVQGLRNDPVSVRLSVPSIDHCSSVQQAGDTDRQRRAHSSTTFSSTTCTAANASSVAFTAADLSCLEMFYA